MEKKTKVIIGVVLGLATLAGLGFYLSKKKKSESSDGTRGMGSSGGANDESYAEVDTRYEAPVNPKLATIDNSKAASYLSKILSNKEITDLRGWLSLIRQERNKDSSKWKDSNGLRGQLSDVGHALYQMNQGGKCSDCWNKGVLLALQDAQ